MKFLRILMIVGMFAIIGCKANEDLEVKEAGPATPTANAKMALDDIAKTGEVGSGMMLLREAVEEIDKSMLTELDAMEKMTDPEQIKAKARALSAKLGSG